jgi:hypothetical protein
MMKCQYCKSEIASDALICPNCRKKTAIGGENTALRFIVAAAVVVVGLFILNVASHPAKPHDPLPDRIKAACDKQYPADLERRDRCQFVLTMQALDRTDANGLERAAREARID